MARWIVGVLCFSAALSLTAPRVVAQPAPSKTPSKVADIVQQRVSGLEAAASEPVSSDLSRLSDAMLQLSAFGHLELDIHAAAPISAEQEAELVALGGWISQRLRIAESLDIGSVGMVQAWLPYDAVDAASALPWVVAITPPDPGHLDTHPLNPINSEGVTLHDADLAQALGATGAGIDVGVISDGVTNLAASQARNELPAVNVILAGAGDEGTAMLEIVHDMAPGANLLFHANGAGVAGHGTALTNLVNAGVEVITEDFAFDTQPAFQQGVLAAQAEAIAASGISIHSSAGNLGQNHAARVLAVSTGAGPDGFNGPFVGCPFLTNNAVAIAPGGDTTFDVVLGNGGSFVLQWSEPRAIFPTAGAGGFTDLDLYVMNAAGTTCFGASAGIQGSGSGDTIEIVTTAAALNGTVAKVVVNVFSTNSAAAPPLLDLRWRRAAATDVTTRAGSLNPDSNYTGLATSSAAVDALTSLIEGFSAGGPVQLGVTTTCPGGVFPCPGTSIAGPGVTDSPGPTWAAADNNAISGVGGFGAGTCPAVNPGDCRFGGTSAAAPHAAGCDALVRDALGAAPAAGTVNALLASSATDFAPAGVDNVTGAGLLDCLEASTAVIQVVKRVDVEPDDVFGDDPSGWTFDVFDDGQPTQVTGATGVLSFRVLPGTYAVNETAGPVGYWLVDAACTDDSDASAVGVAIQDALFGPLQPAAGVTGVAVTAGDRVTCRFDNQHMAGFVTGGGGIRQGKGKNARHVSFGGVASVALDASLHGRFQTGFHNVSNLNVRGKHFHGSLLQILVFGADAGEEPPDPPTAVFNEARFIFDGRVGTLACQLRADVTDHGEPAQSGPDQDSIRLRLDCPGAAFDYDSVSDFPQEEAVGLHHLDAGNLQIHPPRE